MQVGDKYGEEEGRWYSRKVIEGYGIAQWEIIVTDTYTLLGCGSFEVWNGKRKSFEQTFGIMQNQCFISYPIYTL